MSTDAARTGQSDAFGELLRGSLWPTLVAAVVCIVVGVVSSPKAALSAALGAALVVGFFTVTLLVMKRTAELPPTTVMLVVMVTYTVKVLVLGLVMFAVRDVPWLSGYAVGVTITVCALVWLFFELRAYKRLRIFAYDPKGAAALPGQEDPP
jgi:succinate-acetate transporter protein